PKSLTHLDLGDVFNQTIGPNVLPHQLKTLIFGCEFNQTFGANVLPPNLETLILGFEYNQMVFENSLPSNLQLLQIRNKNYDQFPIRLNNPLTAVECLNYHKQFIDSPLRLKAIQLL
ncbi:hypothetical protein DICPUDRAFT_12844, partial [Dictyostelium purpureum]